MKAKYLKGEDIPTTERVDGSIDIFLGNDLYAYGQRRGMRWVMLDYFNTHKKAENARFRAKRNCMLAFKKDGDFATFKFNPNTSVWEKC